MRARRRCRGARPPPPTGPDAWSPFPQDALEPEVTRSLGAHWALWLSVGLILLVLAVGYIRRKWRSQGGERPGWLTWRGPR